MFYASKANNLSTLELVCETDRVDYTRSNAMAETTSLKMHQRLFPLAIGELHENNDYLDQIGFHITLMARRGALPILQYLLRLDIPASAYWLNPPVRADERPCPVQEAARHGHTETVRWLLEEGYDMGADLMSAARGGNPAVMQLLVRHCGNDETSERALAEEALEREHVEVASVPLSSRHYAGRRVQDKLMWNLGSRTGDYRLGSMEKLVLEHNAGIGSNP